jgi:hypothetical protein
MQTYKYSKTIEKTEEKWFDDEVMSINIVKNEDFLDSSPSSKTIIDEHFLS